MPDRYRTPQDLIKGLDAREREARSRLWKLLGEPVTQLMTRLIAQHALDDDAALLTRHALHAIETGLRCRPPGNLANLSWSAFRGSLLVQVAKMAVQPAVGTGQGGSSGTPSLPDCPAYHSEAFYRPSARLGAHSFGGDWYAGRRQDDGSLWIFVADVTGHGYFAHLLAASLPAVWQRCWTTLPAPSPTQFLAAMHELLSDCLPEGIFLECTLVRFTEDGQATIVPAGGTRLFVCNGSGTPQLVKLRGCWLGLRAPSPDEQHTLALAHGDELLLATDGVFEQLDEHGGSEVLTRRLPQRANLFEAVRELLERSLAGTPQRDDITLVLVRRRFPDALVAPSLPFPGSSSSNGEGNVPV